MKTQNNKRKPATVATAEAKCHSDQRLVSGRGYAWLCDFGMCHWVEPGKLILQCRGKPSPEAKAVAVRIITEKDYRRLIAR